jgi:nitrogen-specific signal transduction histidine kinase
MAIAITATICAAGLVLFLQHRAISALHSQTNVILRQLSEQTAADIATELRRTLDGPVFDTLTAVNHPELRAGRLDLVARQFDEGLSSYPHVEQFFAWSTQTEQSAPGQALFYSRNGAGFQADDSLGHAVLELAERYAPTQQIYVAAEAIGPAPGRQVFLRLFWTDARRVDYFAILGFVIDPARVRDQLFGAGRTEWIKALLKRRGEDVPLQLRVVDERGVAIYGNKEAGGLGGNVPFEMLFYPGDEIHSRLAAEVAPKQWTIEVSAIASGGVFAGISEGYGATAFSMALMLVAIGLTIQAHRRSANLAKMQTDFVAHVSHQLKTPLSLLSAATETLQMDRVRSPERFAEYLRTIHAEAARLSHLVQRVLEFSRVQQRHTYEFEEVDIASLVQETVDAFAHGLSTKHFTFAVEQSGPAPIVMADPAALEQVLANLLDNAVKYSDRNKAITVRVTADDAHAVLEVVDRGLGIAPADRPHIFDRFFRSSGSHQRPGFGLGLTIVKELVEGHHGRVEVVSSLGVGSTFRVVLPVQSVRSISADDVPLSAREVTS